MQHTKRISGLCVISFQVDSKISTNSLSIIIFTPVYDNPPKDCHNIWSRIQIPGRFYNLFRHIITKWISAADGLCLAAGLQPLKSPLPSQHITNIRTMLLSSCHRRCDYHLRIHLLGWVLMIPYRHLVDPWRATRHRHIPRGHHHTDRILLPSTQGSRPVVQPRNISPSTPPPIRYQVVDHPPH